MRPAHTHQGRRVIARLNASARLLVAGRRHGIRSAVAVPFADPDHRGMPSAATQDELATFECYMEMRLS